MDADLAADFLPPLNEVVRNENISLYTPFLTPVTEMDQHAFERDRDKEKDRKKKRGTRGRRLIALPDREPVKTNRSRISGGMDDHGASIALAAIPKEPLPLKPTPLRPKTAPRRAAAIAAKANITTMSTELQQDDISAAPSPEQTVTLATRASRRNRVLTASPEPVKPTAVATVTHITPIKEEVAEPVTQAPSAPAPEVDMDVARVKPASTWTCSHCHRPEAVLDDKRRFDGPIGRPNLCSDCGKFPVPPVFTCDTPANRITSQPRSIQPRTPEAKRPPLLLSRTSLHPTLHSRKTVLHRHRRSFQLSRLRQYSQNHQVCSLLASQRLLRDQVRLCSVSLREA
jgi:SWI/SNF-related matrix-associated actin-dependent regulator of chromatin subfamily B protein 1